MAIYQNQAKNKNGPPKNMKERRTAGALPLLSDFKCQIAQIHIFEGPSRSLHSKKKYIHICM